jgi:hypothetical protein
VSFTGIDVENNKKILIPLHASVDVNGASSFEVIREC